MKLICEHIEDVKYITEKREDGKKNFYIEGVFMQGEIVNRNRRTYSSEILEKEVTRYSKELIEKGRAFGELGHPNGPSINLDRVSHIITELRRDGHNFIGKARISDTPMGNIARGIMESGGQLGVSSRGMGSIKENKNGIMEVQDDFYLATAADIVADPSAPGAFVNGIMENKEWLFVEGRFVEVDIVKTKQAIQRAPRKDVEKVAIRLFENFLSKL